MIAQLRTEHLCVDCFSEEDFSNARLIAAAPDLLKACKHAIKYMVREVSTISPQLLDERDRRYYQAEDMVIRAIAKAEGEP